VGHSIDEAAFWLHLLERCAQTMLLVSALAPRDGRPAYTALSHEVAARTHEQVGQPLHGWRGFQPLWEEIVGEEPDLLE
jgi:ribulose-5-phosphate 4-epimerase/fuculose-1-phosphate aldolase